MSDLQTSNSSVQNYGNVDAVTRARVGSLSAHGLLDQQIADTLLLTLEQVVAVKDSEEFKKKYAEVADEVIQRQLDLAEGWDAVEEKALKHVLETLQFNRDPKYSLIAAKTANAAARRKNVGAAKVIDASQTGNTNIIVLNLNQKFVSKTQTVDGAVLDVTPRTPQIERKVSDLPSPKIVDDLLMPVKQRQEKKLLTDLEMAFEQAGVFKDE